MQGPFWHSFPHRKYEYTRESLLKFREEMKAKELAAKTGGDGNGFGGGFGGLGGGAAAPKVRAQTLDCYSGQGKTLHSGKEQCSSLI